MCGIVGFISSSSSEPALIQEMIKGIQHRGPDANGIFINDEKTCALGHTRLSIIDLSEQANQPFYSRDGRYVIIYNGEVYNFKEVREELQSKQGVVFRTSSDTEVILEAFACWGPSMVNKLSGMFALAIYDKQQRSFTLFRDRVGKKPLFYFSGEGLFAFASEIKALLKHPVIQRQAQLDKTMIATFLHLGYIPEPHTGYVNIKKFPSGSWAEVDSNLKMQTHPYWKATEWLKPDGMSVDQAKKELSGRLNRAVEQRLISDVPLGTFLSGGTDSSLVTAIAARHVSSPIKTFSIGFTESKFDESQYARAVASHLKTQHTEYKLSEREALSMLEPYLDHFDEPFADTSAIPTMLVSKLARQEVTVALTGDGGDELFQGYGSYTWANRLDSLKWKLARAPLQGIFSTTRSNRLLRVSKLLEHVKEHQIRSHIFSQEQYFFSQHEIESKLLAQAKDFVPFEYSDPTAVSRNWSAGECQALFDFQYYLKDDLLVKVDRASMYYALECRCPLLDQSVVELALQLDLSLKVKHGKSKWILKELLREHLPDRLIDRPKWGFSIPLAQWLKGDLQYLVDQYLSTEAIQETGIFNPNYIENLKAQFLRGRDYLYNRLWVLIVIQRWLKKQNG